MRKTILHSTLLVVLALLLLPGCARHALDPVSDEQALKAKRWQVVIAADDGTELALTVWQPELEAGQRAPLMLHTHGFGLQRMDGRFGLYENVLYTGQVAKRLWKDGAWLITWDQRGHGDSGDTINLMEPGKEVSDVSRIIDWAQDNLSHLATVDGDPLVGMVGESYGGAVQMMASVRDPRIDAVVPVTTWYDLDLALAPGDVPKGGWMKVLYMMGDWVNFRKLPPMLREAFGDAKQGKITETARDYLADNQLSYYCDREQYPQANALIISGLRDVLFNSLQGLGARDCFRKAGRDVHLVINRDGHLLPSKQFSNELPGWAIDNTLYCNETPLDTEQMAVDWLKGQLNMAAHPTLPSICVSVDKWGVALSEWPHPAEPLDLPPVTLKGNGSGRWEWANLPADFLAGLATESRLSKRFAEPQDGAWRPAFVPLHTATDAQHLVGTPHLVLTADQQDVPVLVALVRRQHGSADLDIVHQQVVPVRTGKPASMPPVAVSLEAGDQLGLMLFSRHGQFNTLDLDFGKGVTFAGQVWLPPVVEHSSDSDTALSQR